MKMLWLSLLLLGAFIAYRSWSESGPGSPASRSDVPRVEASRPHAASGSGVAMDLQNTLDGSGGNSSKTMLDAARGGLATGRD